MDMCQFGMTTPNAQGEPTPAKWQEAYTMADQFPMAIDRPSNAVKASCMLTGYVQADNPAANEI